MIHGVGLGWGVLDFDENGDVSQSANCDWPSGEENLELGKPTPGFLNHHVKTSIVHQLC